VGRLSVDRYDLWRALGQQLRVDSIRSTSKAGSGHPTSSMSAADLIAVLLSAHLRYDFEKADPANDHLIFSKGHAAPLLYAAFKAAGVIDDSELLSLRRLGSRLQGHPTPALPWVDVATGSLGQGLPIGVGIALAAKQLDGSPSRVWVLCGDGELAEGSMWEAFDYAAQMRLDNLVVIVDANGLAQLGPARLGADPDLLVQRLAAFGWHVINIDGHDVVEIDQAYAAATDPVCTAARPTAIVARTLKGKGVAAVEGKLSFHSRLLDDPEAAIQELGGQHDLLIQVPKPDGDANRRLPTGWIAASLGEPSLRHLELPGYKQGDRVAVRAAFGDALSALGRIRERVVVIDAEVATATHVDRFASAHRQRYFNVSVAEQQMVALAIGLQVRGWTTFAVTFAAFLSRAYDFVRMAAVSGVTLRLVGSHPGVSIGPDGASQMGLEDLAMFRAVYSSVVLYPSDANQMSQLVALMAEQEGISYLRSTRAVLPVIYEASEQFRIGGSQVVRSSERDDVTIVGAGITLHEALRAAELLEQDDLQARVIDCYSVKPIDAATVRAAARVTGGRLVTVEDHWPEGGLGDAVLDVFADAAERPRITKLAVSSMPGAGTQDELLAAAGINAEHIATAARRLCRALPCHHTPADPSAGPLGVDRPRPEP
jgi:transketolase